MISVREVLSASWGSEFGTGAVSPGIAISGMRLPVVEDSLAITGNSTGDESLFC
jgi:hypothetical protein